MEEVRNGLGFSKVSESMRRTLAQLSASLNTQSSDLSIQEGLGRNQVDFSRGRVKLIVLRGDFLGLVAFSLVSKRPN